MDDCLLPKTFLTVFIILNFFIGHGQSCDSLQCNCLKNDLNPSGIMFGHLHSKGTWMLSYRDMNMQMENIQIGTKKIADDIVYQNYIMSPKAMKMDMHMLMAMYGITEKLSVMVMLNYNQFSMNMKMLPGTMQMNMNGMIMANQNVSIMNYNTSGLSDSKIYTMYTLLNKANQQFILSGGINIPFGSIDLKGDSKSMLPGYQLPYMMQLGDGTFDLLPGLTYIFNKSRLLWGTQLNGTYRLGYNKRAYVYGNELNANTWLAYRFLPWMSTSLRAEINAADIIYGKDTEQYEVMEPAAKTANYGGTKAFGYVGLNLYLKKVAKSKISFECGLPFYQNLNGVQLTGRSTIYAGWSLLF